MKEKNEKQEVIEVIELLLAPVVDWNVKEVTGYEPKTTLYRMFSMAEKFCKRGYAEIKRLAKQVKEDEKDDVEIMTELTMVLNWKIWEHYKTNEKMAKVYDDLWRKQQNYCFRHFKGADLTYFIRTID